MLRHSHQPPRNVLLAVALLLALAGCPPPSAVRHPPVQEAPAALEPVPPVRLPPPEPALPEPTPPEAPQVLGQNGEFVILRAGPADTLASLAAHYLGDAERWWVVADFNRTRRLSPGQEVVVPLVPLNPSGVRTDGYQTVPILCYHRFGDEQARMVVSAEAFEAQMRYLAENDYRVIPLAALAGFLEGRSPLPERAVVLTMDDGYRSNYEIAFPILKRYRFPATIFVYTDFVNARAALTWPQMREMIDSGLVDVQPHSKAHSNLAYPAASEDSAAFRERVTAEISVPTEALRRNLGVPLHTFAYPYGDAGELAIAALRGTDYRMAATVQSGGNPFYAYPYLLRRTMVYGEDDLAAFRKKLDVFRPQSLR
ncbi:MAG: polysaccharide deacetylase family protein [Thermodesulfobacteriota bacterium]